jgi:hypothetical protein
LNNRGLVGEIQIWARGMELPSPESRIFRNFVSQIGQALERTQLLESGAFMHSAPVNMKVNH